MNKITKIKKYYFILIILIPAIFSIFLTFLIYHRTLYSGFMLDDYLFIHRILNTSLEYKIKWMFLNLYESTSSIKNICGFYRPVYIIWVTINYSLFNLNSYYWHILHLIVQSFNVFMLYLFVFRILKYKIKKVSSRLTLAASAALFFCISPVNYFTVSWLSGIQDILSTGFLFLSLLAFVNFLAKKSKTQHFISAGFYFLALLTKETAIAYIILFPLICFFLRSENTKIKYHCSMIIRTVAGHILILILYMIIRRIVLGKTLSGYDISYAYIFFKTNILKYFTEISFFPTDVHIKGLNLPLIKIVFALLCSALFFLTKNKKIKKVRIELIILGLFWAIIIALPTLPFYYAIWRFYPAIAGISITFSGIIFSYSNKSNLSRLLIIFTLIFFTFINLSILYVRTDEYITEQKMDYDFFFKIKDKLPDLKDGDVIYLVNPYKGKYTYRGNEKVWGISQIELIYNKKLNIQIFDYQNIEQVKPSLLNQSYFLEWKKYPGGEDGRFILRNDLRALAQFHFRKYKFHPAASWEFNDFTTPPPELVKTGYFEFSSFPEYPDKGVIVAFKPQNFFDAEENKIEIRLSAIPSSNNTEINFFYIYSILGLPWHSWHFIPMQIYNDGEYHTYSIDIKPYKKYYDLYWIGGKLYRMGIKFQGSFSNIKIDYVRTLK